MKGVTEKTIEIINILINEGYKTDLDSQIKAIETLNDNLISTPLFLSIIASLKEFRSIKRKQNNR